MDNIQDIISLNELMLYVNFEKNTFIDFSNNRTGLKNGNAFIQDGKATFLANNDCYKYGTGSFITTGDYSIYVIFS